MNWLSSVQVGCRIVRNLHCLITLNGYSKSKFTIITINLYLYSLFFAQK